MQTRALSKRKMFLSPLSVSIPETDQFDFTQNPKFQRDAKMKVYAKENPEMVADMIKIWMKDK